MRQRGKKLARVSVCLVYLYFSVKSTELLVVCCETLSERPTAYLHWLGMSFPTWKCCPGMLKGFCTFAQDFWALGRPKSVHGPAPVLSEASVPACLCCREGLCRYLKTRKAQQPRGVITGHVHSPVPMQTVLAGESPSETPSSGADDTRGKFGEVII